jgi:hypothetical protein
MYLKVVTKESGGSLNILYFRNKHHMVSIILKTFRSFLPRVFRKNELNLESFHYERVENIDHTVIFPEEKNISTVQGR